MDTFELLGTFPVTRKQHDLFKTGNLMSAWSQAYPMLFDDKDVEYASEHAHRGYYFHEWLAAIVLYNTTGYLSLVDHYQYGPHARKNEIFRSFVGDAVADLAKATSTYCPDLFAYLPDRSQWFFVEVKGPSDKLRDNQIEFFNTISELTAKPVYLMQFTRQSGL